ncbi:MAG TPA: flagellar M-ring protein FliF, partial [Opitutaceae bacterium]
DSLVSLQETEFQAVAQGVAQMEAIRAEAPAWQTYVEMARDWMPFVGAGIVLLIFVRVLSRQKPEPVPIEVLSLTPETAAQRVGNSNNVTPELLNQLIKEKPANIGIALRDWVSSSAAQPAGKN